MVLLVVGTLLVALGAGAFLGARWWVGEAQRRDQAAGHAAYLRGECDRAVPRLRRANRPVLGGDRASAWLDPEVSGRAERDRAACVRVQRLFAEADRASGADAVNLYLDHLTGGPDPALRAAVSRRGWALLQSTPPRELVTGNLCTRELWINAHLVPKRERDEYMPRFNMACGDLLLRGARFRAAAGHYDSARGLLHRTVLYEKATVAYARAVLREAETSGTSETRPLGKPLADGTAPALRARGKARVDLYQATKQPPELVMVGPITRVQALASGPWAAPEAMGIPMEGWRCPRDAARTSVIVPAGRYRVLLHAHHEDFLESWTLRAGGLYSLCFRSF